MATVTVPSYTCSPGNMAALPVSGFTLGPATLAVGGQINPSPATGVTTYDGVTTIAATIVQLDDVIDYVAQFLVPDGLETGTAILTDSAQNTASVSLSVVSQYAQSWEYLGEGYEDDPIVPKGAGLDVVLRRASAYIDSYLGASMRQRTWLERHRWSNRRGKNVRTLRARHKPLQALISLAFVSSAYVKFVFNPTDTYVNTDLAYVELLLYNIGNFMLISSFQSIGYSADVMEMVVLAGYSAASTPVFVKEATVMIATELITRARKNKLGLGGLSQLTNGSIANDNLPFAIPDEIKRMLRPTNLPRIY